MPEPQFIESLFRWIVTHPKRIVLLGLVFLLAMGSFLPQLKQDTRSDAFLAPDNPALVYLDKIKTVFGLSDPMVIALVSKDTIFKPEALNLVQLITEYASDVDNIDPDGITSLATENNIVGTEDGMAVDPFFDSGENNDNVIRSQFQANEIRDAIRDFPLYQGSLVAHDESATLIVLELLDEGKAEQTYKDILNMLDQVAKPDGIRIHVAGEGAISGYLGAYIATDAQRLNPLAGLIITLIVLLAFFRFTTTIMANVIIAASVLITLSTMSAFGVPFFVITNALPVILIGISVADCIHIYSEYFERRANHPKESIQDAVVASMLAMWRPITLTSLTTIAGFLGLALAAYMPPFRFFGFFIAIGVSVAWLYSLVFLPAAMSLFKTEAHPFLAAKIRSRQHDVFARIMILLGRFTQANAKGILFTSLIVAGLGLFAATKIIVNEDRIATFNPGEAIYQADRAINEYFDGSNYLDIVIETRIDEGIFDPLVLSKMQALQSYAKSLPNVKGATSIVDYLKQMNRALLGGDEAMYTLPTNKDMIAQYFLLYSASSDPTDFEEEVDFDYRLANIRITMDSGAYVDNKYVVETLETYIIENFNDEAVTATLSGRVNLTYHWIKDLGVSHFTGMGLAMFLVWLVSSLLFRSLLAGTFAVIPVATSILLVYSAMAFWSIPLGIGTSMFAAVAIGLGVDFAIHTIDRLRSLYSQTRDMQATMDQFYPSTGRALFFNLLAIALGFGVLISSKVVPLNNFGSIVAVSVVTSFLVSMTLLPALILLFKPRFITRHSTTQARPSLTITTAKVAGLSLVLGAALLLASNQEVMAEGVVKVVVEVVVEESPPALDLINKVNAVDDGLKVSRHMTMIMQDRRGKVRSREVLSYRKYFGDEKRTVLFYLKPKNVKDTGFLTYDYADNGLDDDQWLYLPALRKARRISASDRGDYFLGTDLSYEDIKKEGKIDTSDYDFKTLKREVIEGRETWLIEALPVSPVIAKELGYGKVHLWVDIEHWVVIRNEIWDVKLNRLKTIVTNDIREVDGILTRHNIKIVNHKTGHSTEFQFSDVDYASPVRDRLFTRQALTRGAP